jgi:type I restriction enzyme R subunit
VEFPIVSLRIRRRRLPHIDIDGATHFITSCLAGSIPALGLRDSDDYERALEANRPDNVSDRDWRVRSWKLVFARADEWLDKNPVVRLLEDERLSAEVVKAMHHFAGVRYELLAFVIMPSHFHWVFRPLETWTQQLPSGKDDPTPREVVMHSLKRHSARQCNQLLGRAGQLCQDESYDYCVRDDAEVIRTIDYIETNPVKTKLADDSHLWACSSACDRRKLGIAAGMPLLRTTP